MQNESVTSLQRLSDSELAARLISIAKGERVATTTMVAHLAELESRGLHLREGYGSLFVYCREVLRLSEHEAYNRIEAARVSRRLPIVLDRLECGDVSLTTIRLLGRHLTRENHVALLDAARGMKKAEVEELVAGLRPGPDVPASIRKLPPPREGQREPGAAEPPPASGPATVSSPTAEAFSGPPTAEAVSGPPTPVAMHQPSRHVPIASSSGRYPPVVPLAPERYKLQVTIGGETLAKLRLVTDLLRHAVPSGDPAVVLDRALTVLAEDLLRKKAALRTRGRSRGTTADAEAVSPVSTPEVAALADGAASGSAEPSRAAEPGCREPVPTGPAPAVPSAAPTVARRASRHLPAAVLRGTWVRDQGRCAYVAPSGRRCGERAFLEFHHVVPFAVGGPATLENVELRCRRHNVYEARLFFGGPAGGAPDSFSERVGQVGM